MTELDIYSLLAQLAAGAGMIMLLSWLIEKFNLFAEWSAEKKSLAVVLLSAIVSVAAQLVIDFVPKETLALIQPYVVNVLKIIGIWLTSQGFHSTHKSLLKGG